MVEGSDYRVFKEGCVVVAASVVDFVGLWLSSSLFRITLLLN